MGLVRFALKNPYAMCFSTDGKLLIGGGSERGSPAVRVCDLNDPDLSRTLIDFKGRIGAIALAPDGQHLAVFERPKFFDHQRLWRLRILDIETGKTLQLLADDDPRMRLTALAFTPDGRTLVGANQSQLSFWSIAPAKQNAR